MVDVPRLLALLERIEEEAADLGARLADAARFRNVLVHLYDDVDDIRVLEIARTRLGDLEAFTRAVAAQVGAD